MMKWVGFMLLGLGIASAVQAQEPTALQDILSHIAKGEPVPFEVNQRADQENLSVAEQVDVVLEQLLALPYEMRQYIFPAVMDIASVPKKIRTHPEIAVWEGKVPTVIAPEMKAFADKYLEDLNPNMYIYLAPKTLTASEDDLPHPNQAMQPQPMAQKPLFRVVGNVKKYPTIQEMYKLPEALRNNPDQGVLTVADIQNMQSGLIALETFIAQKSVSDSAFKTGYRALSRFYTDRFQERVNPFQEKLKRIKLLHAEEELATVLREAGWPDPEKFAQTADAMAKAYRAARMSLSTAIVARRYKTISPENKLKAFVSSALKMYEAFPADIRLVDQHLDQVRQAFIQSGNQLVLNAEVLDETRN